MFNELKNLLEELYSYSEYLGIIKKDIPTILEVEEPILLEILGNKIVPSHAVVKAISVFHDVLEKDLENTIVNNYLELYGEEE